jgi:transcriptional regulator with XRE-family HTH domain
MGARAIFAWNLRRLRVGRSISQEQLAADADIDRAYISELERERGNATLDLLDRLAGVLDVALAEFFKIPTDNIKPIKGLRGGRPSTRSGRTGRPRNTNRQSP